MRILLFGGYGTLGAELRRLNPNIIAPTKTEVNINDQPVVAEYIRRVKPDVVINGAAEINNREIEKDPTSAIQTNIIGAANVAMSCREQKVRLVYISTDYIYKGDRGNYKETDEILPFNLYSWTKLGGEASTVCVANHLIIRTSFDKEFKYTQAFVDKWTSKDYVSEIAPMILKAAESPLTGVLNVGTERKSLYVFAQTSNPGVQPASLESTSFATPYDTSLNLQKWMNYNVENPIAVTKQECRVCGSKTLEKYLDLGLMPLANNLEFTSKRAKEINRFPLQVNFCENCFHSQLSVVVNPQKMFSYYTYRSSINGGYVKHCRKMAKNLQAKYGLTSASFIVDIASNDGTLLKEFKEEIGLKVLGVDPASNLASIAEANGVETINDFWNNDVAVDIVSKHGKADVITATNVFAHVDNVCNFLLACKYAIAENGKIVIEFPYLVNFIENYEYDTIYFEHLSYFGISSLNHLCEQIGLQIVDVEKHSIHGGTVRVTISQNLQARPNDAVRYYLNYEKEEGFQDLKKYSSWASAVEQSIKTFASSVFELKKQGYKIAAFAASAKGNTLLNSAGLNSDIINYIADETPEKIGKFSPGTGIPIVNKHEIEVNPPDYLIILSWNFKNEIIEKINKIYKGKYIIPIPTFTII
jgi:dTDP-4-dehydrorhamnose reductase/2-polyprenyl-3-methyl-5-hydroxy-6-metoxy-1,4-benzoquinol methylase